MTSQIFTIHATTVLSNATVSVLNDYASCAITGISGTMFMASDLWSGYIDDTTANNNVIRIPKGCDLKIWESTVYGIPSTVAIMASADTGSTYTPVNAYMNASSGAQLTVKHTGRPIVIPSPDGKKVVKLAYNTKDTTNNVYADLTVEITESETY